MKLSFSKLLVFLLIISIFSCTKEEKNKEVMNADNINEGNEGNKKEAAYANIISEDLLLVESEKIKIYSKDIWRSIYDSQRAQHGVGNSSMSISDKTEQIINFAINANYVYSKSIEDTEFNKDIRRLLRRFYTGILEGKAVEKKINDYVLSNIKEEEYNESMPKRFEKIIIRQIILMTEEDANEVLKKAQAGEDFIGLVKAYSTGPSTSLRLGLTDPYFYGNGGIFSDIDDEKNAFEMKEGDVYNKVVKSPLGFMIYKVEKIIKLSDDEIEETQSAIRNNAINLKTMRYTQSINEGYKDKVKIFESDFYDAVKGDMNDEKIQETVIAQFNDILIKYYDLDLTPNPILRPVFIKNALNTNYSEYLKRLNIILDILKKEDYFLKDLRDDETYEWDTDPIVKEKISLYYMNYLLKDQRTTEEDIKKYYDDHPEEVTTKDIVDLEIIYLKTKEDALIALKRFKKGESFGSLVAELSIDENTRKNNGFVGRLIKGGKRIPETLEPHIFKLNTGDISEPIEVENGEYVLLYAKEKFPEKILPLEAVSNYLRTKIESEKYYEARTKLFEELKGDDKIIWHDENIIKMVDEVKALIKKKADNISY